jgi:cell wall-associated NlpC family hydrolase
VEKWRTTAEALSCPLDTFIDSAYRYEFWRGPAEVRTIADARQNGLNCIALAHLAMNKLFEVELPSALHCAELYADRQYFNPVAMPSDLQRGDLVWFGIANPPIEPETFVPEYRDGLLVNWRDFPVKHVAIHTGEQDAQNDPLLLHASMLEGTNVVWPLRQFAEHHRYRVCYGASRLALARIMAQA